MSKLFWVAQVVSGGLLLVVLGAHLLMNHTTGGLLDYHGVVQNFRNPWFLTLESFFLIVVLYHAFNGLRAVVMDYVRSERWNRLIARGLAALGAVAAVYGLWLGLVLNGR